MLMDFLQDIQLRLAALISGGRDSFDTSSWSGKASSFGSTEEYCSCCLIDVNKAAGRSAKAQSHCMLPYKKSPSSKPNINALRTMASGRGISAVKKPSDVPAGAWSGAVKSAARKISGWWNSAFGKPAPESIKRLASEFQISYEGEEDEPHFIGIATNNFLDSNWNVMPEAALSEAIEWADKHNITFPLVPWHWPFLDKAEDEELWVNIVVATELGIISPSEFNEILTTVFRQSPFYFGEVEMLYESNGFVVVAGKLKSREIAQALENYENPSGMSMRAITLGEEGSLPEIIRFIEFTHLDLDAAANDITGFKVAEEGNLMEKTKKAEYLKRFFNLDEGEVEAATAEARQRLIDAGLIHAEAQEDNTQQVQGEPEPAAEPAVEPAAEPEPAVEPEPEGEPVAEAEPAVEPESEPEPLGEQTEEPEPVVATVETSEVLVTSETLIAALGGVADVVEALNVRIEKLETEISGLRKSDEEKIEAMFNPREISPLFVASKDEATVLDATGEQEMNASGALPAEPGPIERAVDGALKSL